MDPEADDGGTPEDAQGRDHWGLIRRNDSSHGAYADLKAVVIGSPSLHEGNAFADLTRELDVSVEDEGKTDLDVIELGHVKVPLGGEW